MLVPRPAVTADLPSAKPQNRLRFARFRGRRRCVSPRFTMPVRSLMVSDLEHDGHVDLVAAFQRVASSVTSTRMAARTLSSTAPLRGGISQTGLMSI